MPGHDLPRRLTAEALGTGMLAATVVGSGIMAQRLTPDIGLELLANTIATGAILVVLISIFAPLSGAHFNPAVSLVVFLQRGLTLREMALYVAAQVAGGIGGTLAAHAMFGVPLLEISQHIRGGGAKIFAEFLATFGLIATILAGAKFRADAVPWLVGLYITAAYWFTSSTAFANPAIAIARALTNSFSGIAPASLPGFIAAELAGAGGALWLCTWLLAHPKKL